MNVASFDIGIKNMAYCCLTVDSSFVHIQDWNVIDLINQEKIIVLHPLPSFNELVIKNFIINSKKINEKKKY